MLCPWNANGVHAFSCAVIGCPSCEAPPPKVLLWPYASMCWSKLCDRGQLAGSTTLSLPHLCQVQVGRLLNAAHLSVPCSYACLQVAAQQPNLERC